MTATHVPDKEAQPASVASHMLTFLLKKFQESQPIGETQPFENLLTGFVRSVDRMALDFAKLELRYEQLKSVHGQVLQDQGRQALADKLKRIPLGSNTIHQGFDGTRDPRDEMPSPFGFFVAGVRFAEEQHGITQDLTLGDKS